ncbi:carbohydrate ABC transporter membrane protein 1, CUT1 family [Micromonospora rhizosphaerae]|uniref:Carbohydrate ABC transporter membrane protein 1, CUT1 family n=1 Tax=Micromonospora rhizosphaerae TaxID=568872 RepID=A0A1C6SAR7_9ACTN|nr:sugar ABC transporter permease [Micromonospora rhizosphaerae]SCL26565.1 carbohydrate ABC transporter membrane protein 1, CUT1 family [Micromonospora rhizosphaerae]
MTAVSSPPARRAGPAAEPATTGAVQRRRRRRREALAGVAFAAPMLALFAVFRLAPTFESALLSLTDYHPLAGWNFVGLGNYQRLVADTGFWRALRVTVVYALVFVPFTTVLSLVTAVLLQRLIWARGFFRGVFFLPYVTSTVFAAVIWRWLYSVEGGLINGLLNKAGIGDVPFLNDAPLVLPSIAVMAAWKGFGYSMMILLAGLQTIPEEYLEAARIDGASGFGLFRRITLPLLRPVLFFVIVIETIGALQVFDAMYVMTGGGPVNASYSVVYMLYDQGFKFADFGYASAIGMVLFVVILAVSLIQRRLLDRSPS